jgi:hypothetical protein
MVVFFVNLAYNTRAFVAELRKRLAPDTKRVARKTTPDG